MPMRRVNNCTSSVSSSCFRVSIITCECCKTRTTVPYERHMNESLSGDWQPNSSLTWKMSRELERELLLWQYKAKHLYLSVTSGIVNTIPSNFGASYISGWKFQVFSGSWNRDYGDMKEAMTLHEGRIADTAAETFHRPSIPSQEWWKVTAIVPLVWNVWNYESLYEAL